MADDKLLTRVGDLLAKAEATDSDEEASALVAKAQQLATTHSLDLAVARQQRERASRREEPTQRTVTIGPPGARGAGHLIRLFTTIGRANDVVCDIAHNNSYVIAYGFPSDVDVTEALYLSLASQMAGAADAAIRRGEHKDAPYYSERTGTWRTDARVFRTSFYRGFVEAVGERLTAAREDAAARHAGDADSSGALVLQRKGDEVRAYYRTASDARGSWRGPARRSSSRTAARAGKQAGQRARLRPTAGVAGSRGSLPE